MAANRILDKGGVPIHVFTDDIDQGSIEQLGSLSRLDIVSGRVAVMPDVHVGIGATIGSVVPTRKALIPAAVGVDIGCGMTAVKLSVQASELPDDLKPARAAIEKAVPVGRAGHQRQAAPQKLVDELKPGLDLILEKHPGITKRIRSIEERFRLQLGSLGVETTSSSWLWTRATASGSCCTPDPAGSGTSSGGTSLIWRRRTWSAWTAGHRSARTSTTSRRGPSTSTTTCTPCDGRSATPWRTGAYCSTEMTTPTLARSEPPAAPAAPKVRYITKLDRLDHLTDAERTALQPVYQDCGVTCIDSTRPRTPQKPEVYPLVTGVL